jgi:hypothetical protein
MGCRTATRYDQRYSTFSKIEARAPGPMPAPPPGNSDFIYEGIHIRRSVDPGRPNGSTAICRGYELRLLLAPFDLLQKASRLAYTETVLHEEKHLPVPSARIQRPTVRNAKKGLSLF